MQSATYTSSRPGWLRPAVVSQLLKPMAALLRTGQPSATMDRLFTSQHVTDLQLIVAFSFSAVTLVFMIGAAATLESLSQSQAGMLSLHFWLPAAGNFLNAFGAVFAIFGAVLAWAYQAGSARLGVVDLFACEIDTLCRVTLAVDTVHHYVRRFERNSPATPGNKPYAPARRFTSEENYFPVFENNTKDLEALEARVVTNITAFYTYMKAVRDAQRVLGQFSETADSAASTGVKSGGIDAARNLVYMLFLGLESGRRAMIDLVEFEPEKAERSILILISELEAYGFLRTQFTDERDIRYGRLMLRLPCYQCEVPKLWSLVEAGRAAAAEASSAAFTVSKWEPASRLLDELKRVYAAATCPAEAKTLAAGA